MRLWIAGGAVNGFLSVAMGALAAHALCNRVGAEALGWIETGARYGAIHALALLALAALAARGGGRLLALAGWAFLGGTVLFSGSLYIMGVSGGRALAPLVPIGGLLFLVGWGLLVIYAFRHGAAKLYPTDGGERRERP